MKRTLASRRPASWSPTVRGRIDALGSLPTVVWDPNGGTLRLDWEAVPEAWLEIKFPSFDQRRDGGDDEDSEDSDGVERRPTKRSKAVESSVEAASAAKTGGAGEEPISAPARFPWIGTVQMDENGTSFVKTVDGERLFFENYVGINPFRGIGSQSRSVAIDGSGELDGGPRLFESPTSLPAEAMQSQLSFRLDKDGSGMWDNSTDPEHTGHVFSEGTHVTYTRRLPSELKKFRNGDHNTVAMYHISNSSAVQERSLPDKFDGFAFRVKAVWKELGA
jgi:hypothetical protein